MANPFQKSLAEPLIRSLAAQESTVDEEWEAKVIRLSELVEYRVSMTCIAMLGTAMLAKALQPDVNLFWFKPTHVPSEHRSQAYSARTLCHTVLVPLSAEYGFSLGVSGREPLNNQPFFRMERLDDGTPVNAAAKSAFDYMMALIGDLQTITSADKAKAALHAFIAVRRKYITSYRPSDGDYEANPSELLGAIEKFLAGNSDGGANAQAIAAGIIDAALGSTRVDSGRINDPSRHYPGDVCIWADSERKQVSRSIEVRDKDVSPADIHIFARRCLGDGVQDCGVLMVGRNQRPFDKREVMEWGDAQGISIKLWVGWSSFLRDALFWSERGSMVVSAEIASAIRERLIAAEIREAHLQHWDEITATKV